MASKYDKERQAIGLVSGGTGKSKYDGERQLMNPTVKYGSVDQRAGSARARASAEAQQAKKNANKERENRERQAFESGARAISQPVKVEPKKKEPSGYQKIVQGINNRLYGQQQQEEFEPLARQLGSLHDRSRINLPGRADEAVSNFVQGAGDTASFGLSTAINRGMGRDDVASGALDSKAGKAGQIAGYLLPGAAIERGAAKLLQPAIGRLGAIGRGAITGGVAGAVDAAGQELGDVAFRDREFDPINVALGGGLGGAAGAAVPAIGKALQPVRDRMALNREVKDFIGRTKKPDTVTAKVQAVEKNTAPKQDWYSKLFGSQGVGITPGAKSGKELIDTHIVDRPKAQSSLLDRVGETVSNTNQNLVDRFSPFKLINQRTYDAAMDSTRANNLANVTIKDKFVDLEGNVIGKSLKDVYANVPRGQKHIADRYAIMRDAVNRMDRGLKVYGEEAWFPKSSDEAAAMVTQLEARYPWLKNFGDDWNQFNRNRQNMWVQSGIASQELVDTLRHTNPNYAPMFRQQDAVGLKNKLAINSAKSGFSGQKAPVKRAVGSSRKIIDPAQGMIETTGTSYNAMMRNRAMMNIYDAVKADPDRFKGVIEIVEENADMKNATLKRINEALEENGPDGIAEMLNDELTSIFKKSSQATSKNDAVVTVMVNGDPVKMRVTDPSLLKAIEGVSPEQLGAITKVFDAISRGIKYAATGGAAPIQGLKLAFRDLPIALAQSKDKKRFIADVSHALVSQVADWLPDFVPGARNLGKLAREYYRAGGGYEAYLKGDSRIRAVSSDITRDPILSGRNLLKTAKKVNPFRPLKGFGDAMENIPRIAAFNAEMRKAGWNRDPETVRRAIEAAREATVNWSRRGYKGAEIESFLPYSNAAVQGTYRLVKRFKEQPISAIALIMGIAGAKIAAYEQFKDDPDYQYRSKFEKGIPVSKRPDGKFNVIPVEPTEAFIADQVLNFYKWAKDRDNAPSAKETIQEGVDAFLPKYVSGPVAALTQQGKALDIKAGMANLTGGSAFEPINAIVTGKNFFGGDIVPREYQGLSTDLQSNETTSAAGKWAAENLGIDAFTFDYIAQKFGGDLAKVGMPMTSDVGKGDPVGNIVDEVLTRLKLLEDPVMKNRIADEFYSYANAVSQAKAANSRKDIPLPDWYQKAYDEVTSQKKNSLSTRISELNGTKKDIQRDISLSAKERADQLREVQSQMNLLRIQGIKRLEELGVPKKGN